MLRPPTVNTCRYVTALSRFWGASLIEKAKFRRLQLIYCPKEKALVSGQELKSAGKAMAVHWLNTSLE